MSDTSKQPKWDIYEAVILFDAYLESLNGKQPKSRIIKRVSADLRQMAVNRGISIDDIYRNENGISYQIRSMESAYKGHTVFVHTTILFDETVELYRTDRIKYLELLKAAKEMVLGKNAERSSEDIGMLDSNKNNFLVSDSCQKSNGFARKKARKYFRDDKELFYCWLRDIKCLPEKDCASYVSVVSKADDLAKKMHHGSRLLCFDKAELQNTLNILFPDAQFLQFYNKHSQKLNLYFEYMGIDISSLPIPAPPVQNNVVAILRESNIPYANTNGNYFFVKKTDIASQVLKRIRACPETISVTSYYFGGENCFRIRLNESICEDKNTSSDNNENPVSIIVPESETEADSQFCSGGISVEPHIVPETSDAAIPEKAHPCVGPASKKLETKADEENAGIKKVLTTHYAYGFKVDSIRELLRFRQFAESLDVSLPENDEDLKAAILSSGSIIDDRVYCKNDDLPLMLQNLVNEASASGTCVIYYESLFCKNAAQMSSYVITSEDMLKEYLQQYISGWAFSKKFMAKGQKETEKKAVTNELRRVWGDDQTASVSELSNRLPFIPLSNIWRVISGNDLFVLVSEGVYLFLERFHISENEAEDILDYVETTCEENGFASLSDVPLGDIEEENYLLSSLAIYNAVFKKVLSDKYTLNGKIITKGNPDLDAIALLKHYISGKEECSFDEIADKLIDLIGGVNRQYAFQALYDDMVRVDISRYVSNQSVSFNVDMIDSVISSFITDKFGAIKDITTFAMFPICGQNWNHYLLESYCYKYSKKYSLHVIHFNDKNAGIIAEKEFNIPYNEMLALALSKADVELSPEVIGPYLFNTGYLSKSKYAKLADISQKAKELKKQR